MKKYDIKLADLSQATEGMKAINQQISEQQNQMAEEMNKTFALKEQKEQEAIKREVELNEMTKQIVENTSHLKEMVDLIRDNNKVNEEILELYKEMLNVTKAQSEEEAKNIVWEVAEKAKQSNEAISSVTGLLKFGELLIGTMFN